MKIVVALAAALVLSGCSLAGLIRSDSVDYNQVYQDVTNIGLVTNILRARDHAPLNFSTLSDIRTGITTSGSASESMPIGAVGRSTARGDEGVGLSMSTSPSFEIAPIDTQKFTEGILTPIDPVVAKYYFNRDLSQKLLMYLLFSEISIGLPTSANPKPGAPPQQFYNDPTQPDELKQFIAFVDKVFPPGSPTRHVIHANSYTPMEPIGPAFAYSPTVKNLKDLLSIDPTKHRMFYNPATKTVRLFAVSAHPEVIFCKGNVPLPMLATPNVPLGLRAIPPSAARMSPAARAKLQREINQENQQGERLFAGLRDLEKAVCNSSSASMTETGESGSARFGTIYIRSVEGIIQYLGALERRDPAGRESSALLTRDLGYALFSLTRDSAESRFGVNYDGATYYVKNYGGDDRTIEVLALLSQLLNLNKVASEIPTTRPVEIVP
jgi:hypothetical protein